MLSLPDIVSHPDDTPDANIRLMKDAFELQQLKINELENLSERIKNITMSKDLNSVNK